MVFYIILGILVGVPAYLLLNTVLMLITRPFMAISIWLVLRSWGLKSTFWNEIKGGRESLADSWGKWKSKLLGWMALIAILVVFICVLIYRLCWLVYQFLGLWWSVVKFFWNLGAAKKKIRIRKR